MRGAGALLAMAFSAVALGADVGVRIGAGGGVALPGLAPRVEVVLGADLDGYRPLAGGTALLADAAVDLRYSPLDAALSASGAAGALLTLDRDRFLGRIELTALGDLSAELAGSPSLTPSGEASLALSGSWNGARAAAAAEAALRVLGGDRISWSPGARVRLSGALGAGVVAEAGAGCDVEVTALGGVEPVAAADARLEWFPDVPVSFRIAGSFERRLSDAVETVTVAGADVAVPGYWGYAAARLSLGLSALVGPRVDLRLAAPASIRFADHGAITDTAVLAEREWRVEIEPRAEVGVVLSRRLELTLWATDLVAFSNAAATTQSVSAGLTIGLAVR